MTEGDALKALAGDNCNIAQVDVTKPDSIAKFKELIGDEPVDVLVNIAGSSFPSSP